MTTFALIHGGGDVGWSWHLVAAELQARGHDAVAPDLPCDDDSSTFDDYADTVVDALGDRAGDGGLVVVAHSLGGFTGPLVCERVPVDRLVLLAAMVPAPGEPPGDWWENVGYGPAVQEQAALDGGLTGNDDELVSFLHDVPSELAREALARGRDQSGTPMTPPWPLAAWPDVPTHALICRDDRFFPPALLRRVARDRLGLVADEIDGSHCVALSRPRELAERLAAYAEA
ncbi:alpha/beta fold hydrolase [Conexibacter woesei]|uniref:Alpha/beta hydrolase fold protein n=1 Tax=Conexibacter woesei (strain DSM 14684 / CCUG 47730 / CIP 108061 / JCM 11494 / NBRC 100937 / ID131577) TaxID=469383 RepID=D3FC03_CONWI|nr:alpha/beta hydrolase [Conexibacter woesei]ADB51418.1 alpha/beta hydrolase fold protein [Conexibacter woesei DSM 14684]